MRIMFFSTKYLYDVLLVVHLLFSCEVNDVRRQPSDIRKTFIKYCIVGWGLPAVVVALSSVLDFSEALAIGYGLLINIAGLFMQKHVCGLARGYQIALHYKAN